MRSFFFNQQGEPSKDVFHSDGKLRMGKEFEYTTNTSWLEDQYHGNDGTSNNEFLRSRVTPRKISFCALCVGFVFLLLIIRIGYLQLWKGAHYFFLANRNSTHETALEAQRGIIVDRNNQQLVRNVPSFTFVVRPELLPAKDDDLKKTILKISKAIDISPPEITEKLDQFKKYQNDSIPLKANLSHDEALRLGAIFVDTPGVEIQIGSRREYALADQISSLSHIIGYVGAVSPRDMDKNPDYLPDEVIGKNGIELAYEDLLRGKNGKQEIEVDALGHEKSVLSVVPPENGKNIALSLDSNFQKFTEEVLSNELRVRGKKRGAAIALDPRTGEIIALVSLPAYNNNSFAKGITKDEYAKLINDKNQPLFARAISGEYPSGSTIKPIIALAALAEKIITPATTVLSTGGIHYDRWFFPDWKAGGHGIVNVYRALAESVNTFFYMIGGGYRDFKGLGVSGMEKYLQKFSFGNLTKVDLPNEASGLIPNEAWKLRTRNEPWYIGDTYHMAIGQGDILVTPLQLCVAIAAIANGGLVYEPHLSKNLNGVVLADNREFGDEFQVIRDAMRQTITSGSAQSLKDLPWKIAGKTGTAQWKIGASPHAWFTSFAPYDNPEIVITVLIEEGGEGSFAAVPVARRMYDYYFSRNDQVSSAKF